MARKPTLPIDPKELYEEKVVFVIEYAESSVYGKFLSRLGNRCNTLFEATQFNEYEEAHKHIVDNMLEGVSIMKVWV